MARFEDNGWIDLALLNGWVNHSATWGTAAYRVMPDGVIYFKGLIRSGGSNVPIAVLPYNLAPKLNALFSLDTDTGAGRLDVIGKQDAAVGSLIHRRGGTSYLSLENITLVVDQ